MKTKKMFTPFVLLLLFIFMASIMTGEAGGVTFHVSSTIDAVDANPGDGFCASSEGECTLRAAIMEANALEVVDNIWIPAGTYLLTIDGSDEDDSAQGDLDIIDDLNISGEIAWDGKPAAMVQGDNADRVLHILPGATVDIEHLTITGGHVEDPVGGAGIFNLGDLHLYGVHVVGNSTSGTGGGIRNDGELFLDSSHVQNNFAFEGGGIYNLNQLGLYVTTIYNNTTSGAGGGIYNAQDADCGIKWGTVNSNTVTGEADGGGIYNLGHLNINDLVEASGNQTGGSGGGIFNQGTMEVYYLDLVRNIANDTGGGIANRGHIEMDTTTFVENTASYGGGFANIEGSLTLKYGHFERNTANQGGAIGNQSEALLDEVIIQYNSAFDGGAIINENFDDQTKGSMTILASKLIGNMANARGGGILNKGVSLDIQDSTLAYNSAEDGAGIFNLKGSVSLKNTNIESGSAAILGGGVLNNDLFEMVSSEVSGNDAILGGGISNALNANLTVISSTLEENTAQMGAAVHNFGQAILIDSSIMNNSANQGGGLYNDAGYARFTRCLIYGNQANTGGGIYNVETFGIEPDLDVSGPSDVVPVGIEVETSTISGNSATDLGGAIYTARSVRIVNSTISGNGEYSIYLSSNSSFAEIGNSIIAGSVSGESNCTGEPNIVSLDYNLEAGKSCGFSEPHDLIDTDPMLMISQDKPVLELHPMSPAIDSGSETLCGEVDQVGTPRPLDGDGDGIAVCDIGAFEAPAYDLIFADVPLGHWAYDYIISLYEDGYVAGCATEPERLFCPENSMNRAESSVFVVRGIHPDEPGYIPPPPTIQYFNDVPIGAQEEWFSKWVTELFEQGFTSGCSENPPLYCPLDTHNRAEATVFYMRMLNGADFEPDEPTEQHFKDVALGEWYARWVEAAFAAEIIQPCQTDMQNMLFRPEEDLTRDEAACMMFQAISKQVKGSVVIEEGKCCVGGNAGETIQVDATFEASSPTGTVTEMRVLSGNREFSDSEIVNAAWEPFTTQKAFSVEVPLNWSTFYVYVQYRNSDGYTSPIYFDDISVEGQPDDPTPTHPPPTPTPTPLPPTPPTPEGD